MAADATDRAITDIWLHGLSELTDPELLQVIEIIVVILKNRGTI